MRFLGNLLPKEHDGAGRYGCAVDLVPAPDSLIRKAVIGGRQISISVGDVVRSAFFRHQSAIDVTYKDFGADRQSFELGFFELRSGEDQASGVEINRC